MRALLLSIAILACTPALAVAQTPADTAPTATTGVPPVTATAPAAPAAPATTTTPVVEINVPAEEDSGPAPLVVGLLVALGLAALILVAWGLLRLTAWEPAWLPRLRHSLGEAGYRAGGTWAQVRDWFSPHHR